jgi:pimeloyl-ACP methyl ester carboxylesterase
MKAFVLLGFAYFIMQLMLSKLILFSARLARHHGPRARNSSTMTTAKDSRIFKLADGRAICYAEYGRPQGRPLLWFHGYPASRFEAIGADHIAKARNIRLLALDRPGFGLSTHDPNRRITDWPDDVRAFAEHLNLDRFAVLGGSGGGPYALVCAHSLPREMLTAVGVLAGAGHWGSGTQDVASYRQALSLGSVYAPYMTAMLLSGIVGSLRWLTSTQAATTRIDAWLESVKTDPKYSEKKPWQTPSPDLPIEEQRARVLKLAYSGFTQGVQGTVLEAKLLSTDWGFELGDIAHDKVLMWHGTEDKNVSFRMAQWIADRVPGAKLTPLEGVDHGGAFRYIEEVMMMLMGDEVPEQEDRQETQL